MEHENYDLRTHIQHYATGQNNPNSILLKQRGLANRLARLQRTKILIQVDCIVHEGWPLMLIKEGNEQRNQNSTPIKVLKRMCFRY